MTERIVAIDFGTSSTVVKWKMYENGIPRGNKEDTESVKFQNNSSTCPTLALKKANGEFCFGYDALELKGTVYRNFKIDLSKPDAENNAELVDVLHRFFRYLYKKLEEQCRSAHIEKDTVYLSFPAKFTVPYKKTLIKAALNAGFENVSGMDEPTAAIHAFLTLKLDELQEKKLINKNQKYTFMIIDMGAGTTDFAICRHNTGNNETTLLSTWPSVDYPVYFGGAEVDSLICEYFLSHIEKSTGKRHYGENDIIAQCKQWKENMLPHALKSGEEIPEPVFMNSARAFTADIQPLPALNLESFFAFTRGYFEKFPCMVNECLSQAADNNSFKGGEDIDFVVLTGGHSQWHFLPDMLMSRMNGFEKIDLPKIKTEEMIFKMDFPGETVADGLLFKPMRPKFSTVATNNKWVRFIFGGDINRCSNIIEIVSIGDVLPIITYNEPFTAYGGMDTKFLARKYPGVCQFFVGKHIETARTYEREFVAEPRFRDNAKIIVNGFLYDGFSRCPFLQVRFNISMNEQQALYLSGSITVDGYASKNTLSFSLYE